ncbi:MAG: MGH1-like glycoside hydrolase domain-containing protein, partial [Kiritimatiellia bacterium]
MKARLMYGLVALCAAAACAAAQAGNNEPVEGLYHRVLNMELVRRSFDRFNADDEELYRNTIPNDRALATIGRQIPLFECPDEEIERTYYFRWWTYRKHLRKTDQGWVVTEFVPNVGWAGKNNTISCPLGHHLREGRWLRDPAYLDDYTRFMLKEGWISGARGYLCWPAWATLERAKVTGDFKQARDLLPDFVRNYETWEAGWNVRGLSLRDVPNTRSYNGPTIKTGFRAERGLFDYVGDREGSEFALSLDGARPMVNAAMWAEASAIAELAARTGDAALRARFQGKAETLAANIRARLWNPARGFFVSLGVNGEQDTVRELHGYAPFYFGLPLDAGYDVAWSALVDAKNGFAAPKGLTFPAQDAPGFARGAPDFTAHECLWNG